MKTKQKNVRLKLAYAAALETFDGQGAAIIHEALDHSPHQPFRKELAKQKEAYANKTSNSSTGHPQAEAIGQEFTD